MQVWAIPVSLATTKGIELSFSSPATKMIQFADRPLPVLCVQTGVTPKRWVSPFGDLRIKACWRLPEAYRS